MAPKPGTALGYTIERHNASDTTWLVEGHLHDDGTIVIARAMPLYSLDGFTGQWGEFALLTLNAEDNRAAYPTTKELARRHRERDYPGCWTILHHTAHTA